MTAKKSQAPGAPGMGLILLLAWLGAVGWVGAVAYVPALPDIARELGASESSAKVTLTVFITTFALTHLLYGPLSDRHGRRRILLGSLLIYVLGCVAVALAPSVGWMTGARVLQALGAVGGVVLARAIARDLWSFDQIRRPLALINSVSALAPAAAFSLGGILAAVIGWRGLFWLVAAITLATFVLAWLRLPESHTVRDAKLYGGRRMLTNLAVMFRLPLFWAYTLSYSWQGGAIFTFMTGAPFLVIGELGVSPERFGLLTALMPIGFVVGSALTSRLVGRYPVARLMTVGTAISVAAALVMLAAVFGEWVSVTVLFACIFVYTFGMGIASPNAIAGALEVRPETIGAASALIGFSQLGHSSLASFLVTRFDTAGGRNMALLILVLGAGAFVATLTAIALQRRRDQAARKSSGPPTLT